MFYANESINKRLIGRSVRVSICVHISSPKLVYEFVIKFGVGGCLLTVGSEQRVLRFELLTAMNELIVVFWVVTRSVI